VCFLVHIQRTAAVKLMYHLEFQRKWGRWEHAQGCGWLYIPTSKISRKTKGHYCVRLRLSKEKYWLSRLFRIPHLSFSIHALNTLQKFHTALRLVHR
jgi:hypothetical protein